MKDRHRFGTPTLTILAGMTAVCVLSLHSADIAESAEVSGLLSDASHEAFQLSEDAADFESYTRSNSTRGEQTATFGQMKQHVNAANLTLAKLQGVKISASLWQKASIDRLSPLLKELTSDTERLIQLGNGNPLRLAMPECRDFAEANSRVADKLATLVADFVNYETTRSRLERLFGKLRDLDSEQPTIPVAEDSSAVAHASFSQFDASHICVEQPGVTWFAHVKWLPSIKERHRHGNGTGACSKTTKNPRRPSGVLACLAD